MSTRFPRSIIALFVLCAFVFTMIAPRPASADGAASTRNIILGAAAVAAGVIIYSNVQHKRAAARNSVVGTTRDGGVVYSDGRITYPNGHTLYTSNGNGRQCGYDSSHERCGARPVAYYAQGSGDSVRGWHDNGRHEGWAQKDHGHGNERHQHHHDHDHDGREN